MDQKDTENDKKDSQKTRKDPNPSAQLVLIIKNLKKIIYKKEHPSQHAPERNKVFSEAHALNWVTLGLVFVNAILAWGTLKLYQQAVNQSGAAIMSAKAAKVEAETAQQSLILAKQNFRVENQALIWLEIQPSVISRGDSGSRIFLSMKNFGKTPAESLCYWSTCFFSKNKIPRRPQIGRLSQNPIILTAEGTHYFDPDTIAMKYMNDTDPVAFQKSSLNMFIYGIITYKDFTGKVDTSEFMSIYSGTGFNGDDHFSSVGLLNKMGY